MAFSGSSLHHLLSKAVPSPPAILALLCAGYVFENASAISPYLEHPRTGPTSQFCSQLAKNLECHVLAGYPEQLAEDEERTPLVLDDPDDDSDAGSNELDKEMAERARVGLGESDEEDEGLAVGANSCLLYDPSGEWVGGYRKTNLYTTDKTWAKAGTLTFSSILTSSN